ncbi:MAG: cytochrome c biogenesis protein CcsA [Fimbriimonas sp.]
MNEELLNGLRQAEPWSLTMGHVGSTLVLVGLAFFLASLIANLIGPKWSLSERVSSLGFWLGSACLFAVFGVLTSLFVKDQFQYSYVFARADFTNEPYYKVAGVWAGQQGSFLLWGLTSCTFGLLALPRAGQYRRWATAVFAIFLGSLCGILAYETPFGLLEGAAMNGKVFIPPNGNGLTPSLHNYWVVIHPPTIFVGFGALTLLFAYAVSAILTGDLTDWVRRVRPWANATLGILALGICMGGFWAYETLGWGGFWMWDPVENVSLVPWILLVGFVHAMIVQTSRKRWHGATLIFAALPFLTFVYGTFLTRSGFLADVSVHSFAEMDRSARWILLGFLGFATFGFIGIYLARGRGLAKALDVPAPDSGIERESAYRSGNLILSLLAVGISMGMSWPLVGALTGKTVAVVEERLYHQVVAWLFLPLMILMAIAPFLSWRLMKREEISERTRNIFALSIFLTGLAVFGFRNPTWGVHMVKDASVAFPFGYRAPLLPWMAVLTFVCIFVAVANMARAIEVAKKSKIGIGGFVSHFGFAILLAGLIISRGFERKERAFVREGQPQKALDFTLAYMGPTDPDLKDRNGKVRFQLDSPEGRWIAEPGLYYTISRDGQDQPMVWPDINRTLSHDTYVSLLPPVIFVWENPQTLKVGQTITQNDITVTYLEPTREGQPGTTGAKFGAKLKITAGGQTHIVSPSLQLAQGGPPVPSIELVGPELATTLMGMNAADRSINVQMLFASPIYPIDLFYKPLTLLVWAGTGILFVGGFWSAMNRRFRPKPSESEVTAAGSE